MRGRFAMALGAGALAGAAQAQVGAPGNATSAAVREDQLLNALKQVDGRVSIPDGKSGVLIQPAGRDYRAWHQETLPWLGGIAILGMLVLLALFYLLRGRIRVVGGFSGRLVTRFGGFERFTHWMTATSFIVLGLTGLNVAYGRALLLPLLGESAFSGLSQWAKYAHNFVAFPFMLGIAIMLLLWVRDNLPSRLDLEWIKRGGGLLKGDHPPARRFNAGQKLIYWSTMLGGIALSVTGVTLLFPFAYTDIGGMQTAGLLHGGVAVVMVAIILAHIYIGSLGMEGAFAAMGSGQVDVNWAKEHHSLWLAEQGARTSLDPKGRPVAAE